MRKAGSGHRGRRFIAGAVTAGVLTLVAAVPAAAEQVEIFSAGGTFNSTSESGTGRMTSNAQTQGVGATPDPFHRNEFVVDNFGRVNAQLAVQGGRTYRVATTLNGAVTNESATGEATARGFVEVELYSCCFAGETTFLTAKEEELPASAGQVQVVQEVFVPQDTYLTPNVLLHSRATAFTDTLDTASVSSSTETTSIDISPAGDAPPPPSGGPKPGNGGLAGLVGKVLGGVGEIVGVKRNEERGTATIAMRMSEPATASLAGSRKVKAASTEAEQAGTVKLQVRLRGNEMRRLRARAEDRGRASVNVAVTVACDPPGGPAYSTKGKIRLVLED